MYHIEELEVAQCFPQCKNLKLRILSGDPTMNHWAAGLLNQTAASPRKPSGPKSR